MASRKEREEAFARKGIRPLGESLARLLPGDVIHDVAPIHANGDYQARIKAVESAQMKRLRKLEKRAKRG